jgi:hypothetical protein
LGLKNAGLQISFKHGSGLGFLGAYVVRDLLGVGVWPCGLGLLVCVVKAQRSGLGPHRPYLEIHFKISTRRGRTVMFT